MARISHFDIEPIFGAMVKIYVCTLLVYILLTATVELLYVACYRNALFMALRKMTFEIRRPMMVKSMQCYAF